MHREPCTGTHRPCPRHLPRKARAQGSARHLPADVWQARELKTDPQRAPYCVWETITAGQPASRMHALSTFTTLRSSTLLVLAQPTCHHDSRTLPGPPIPHKPTTQPCRMHTRRGGRRPSIAHIDPSPSWGHARPHEAAHRRHPSTCPKTNQRCLAMTKPCTRHSTHACKACSRCARLAAVQPAGAPTAPWKPRRRVALHGSAVQPVAPCVRQPSDGITPNSPHRSLQRIGHTAPRLLSIHPHARSTSARCPALRTFAHLSMRPAARRAPSLRHAAAARAHHPRGSSHSPQPFILVYYGRMQTPTQATTLGREGQNHKYMWLMHT